MMMADGTNNTGVSLARTMVSFSPETVQEFTVQTSAFSAEYGTTGGGVINATTKSGTNEFHGTALWYNRNPDFAAAPFTQAASNRPVPTLKYNQFSLAAGGPVYIPKVYNGKNRTFWFAAVEPYYRRDHLDQYGLLPTDGMRNGDFSGLVNTASGWLPQSVVNQFTVDRARQRADARRQRDLRPVQPGRQPVHAGHAPHRASQLTLPFPGNVIPKSMLDTAASRRCRYIAPARHLLSQQQRPISNIFAPRLPAAGRDALHGPRRPDHRANNRIYGRYSDHADREDPGHAGQPHQQRRAL